MGYLFFTTINARKHGGKKREMKKEIGSGGSLSNSLLHRIACATRNKIEFPHFSSLYEWTFGEPFCAQVFLFPFIFREICFQPTVDYMVGIK